MITDLQELASSGNSAVIAGHTLRAPRLIEWADAEIEANRNYLQSVALAAAELPEGVRQGMHARAVDNLKDHPLVFGSAGFDAWALSAGALPILVWLSLRISQPKVSRQQAAQILSSGDGDAIARAVWDLWGYRDAKKRPALPSDQGLDGGADGGASSGNLRAAGADTDTAISRK
jgi:hypothetical protein